MAIPNTTSDKTPRTIPGVTCTKGKKNPVTLVSTVVAKNTDVSASMRLFAIIPTIAIKPDTIATRLMTTCNNVNVAKLIPSTMDASGEKHNTTPAEEQAHGADCVRVWLLSHPAEQKLTY